MMFRGLSAHGGILPDTATIPCVFFFFFVLQLKFFFLCCSEALAKSLDRMFFVAMMMPARLSLMPSDPFSNKVTEN